MGNTRMSSRIFDGAILRTSSLFAASLLILLVFLVVFVLIRGGDYFWPEPLYRLHYQSHQQEPEQQVFAELRRVSHTESGIEWRFSISSAEQITSHALFITQDQITKRELAPDAYRIFLDDGTKILANLLYIHGPDNTQMAVGDFDDVRQSALTLSEDINHIREGELADIHQQLAELNLRGVESDAPAVKKLTDRFYLLDAQVTKLQQEQAQYQLQLALADGSKMTVPVFEVRNLEQPNQHSVFGKLLMAGENLLHFLFDSPRQFGQAGGVYPALFGTVLMVLLMTIIVTPIGVLAAIYLHEYAPNNWVTALLRVSVNNLAGVPSVVYGVFGLGFFVYTLGSGIDELLFSEYLPTPTLGSPGLFWASLTMAMLTLPVVIVATEEGLRRVPDGLRLGSYALGATRAETIWRTVVPMASPGIMTGVILAIARGAGEVAPLILVGAVKYAPSLPIDTEFPFLHLERQFMHLGALIYDGAFHSQNFGQGSPFMFAACLLLLLIVFALNMCAVGIRVKLRRLYGQN